MGADFPPREQGAACVCAFPLSERVLLGWRLSSAVCCECSVGVAPMRLNRSHTSPRLCPFETLGVSNFELSSLDNDCQTHSCSPEMWGGLALRLAEARHPGQPPTARGVKRTIGRTPAAAGFGCERRHRVLRAACGTVRLVRRSAYSYSHRDLF